MANGPLDTTKLHGSFDILTTERGTTPQYLIDGIPIDVSGADTIIEVSANYQATINDDIIVCTGTFTVTLPLLANTFKKVIIKSTTGTITVDGNGSPVETPTSLTPNQANEFTPVSTGWVQV